MRLHCLIHAPFEGLGYFEHWAIRNHIQLTQTHCYDPEHSLPDPADYDLLLIMGGPQDLNKLEDYPYLKEEIKLIKNTMVLDKSVLGVCLGAQLISEALGAKTEPSPHKEIGFFPITLSSAGEDDAIFQHFPLEFTVGHWHNDMPGLPEGAIIIAESDGCPRQIIKYSDKIYGFQCHMEFTKENIINMLEHCPDDLQTGQYIQDKATMLGFDYKTMAQNLDSFMDLFCQ